MTDLLCIKLGPTVAGSPFDLDLDALDPPEVDPGAVKVIAEVKEDKKGGWTFTVCKLERKFIFLFLEVFFN